MEGAGATVDFTLMQGEGMEDCDDGVGDNGAQLARALQWKLGLDQSARLRVHDSLPERLGQRLYEVDHGEGEMEMERTLLAWL